MKEFSSRILHKFHRIVLFSICFIIVLYESYNGLQKYLSYPQGSKVSTVFAANFNFPAITICQDYRMGERYNQMFLQDCGLKHENEIIYEAKWVGSKNSTNCQNPKIFYEKAVSKLEAMLIRIEITFLTGMIFVFELYKL